MSSIAVESGGEVVIGVDPHPGSHTFFAVNGIGKVLSEKRVENTAAGLQQLWVWAREFPLRRWAVEGPGNQFAKALVDDLLAAGEQLHAVSPGMTAQYRKRGQRGKDDAIDAGSAARVVLANSDLPVYLPTAYEKELKELTRTHQHLISKCRSTRMALREREVLLVREALEHAAGAFEAAARDLKKLIKKAVVGIAPQLFARQGVGPIVAGILLAEVGRIERFRDEHAFAAYAGCAPLPWASGASSTVRVNPGGNRRLNYAMHIVVMTRLRIDPRTRQYRDRKLAEGKTPREVFRFLKTYVARELFRALRDIHQLATAA
jgi:transposase